MSGSADVRSLAEPRNPFLEEGVDLAPAAPPKPSRDDVEAALARIWRATLGPKGRDATLHILHVPVGLRRLLRFVNEAEAALGVKIPPTALMRLGTIKRLAEAIERGEWPEPSPLALLRDGDGEDALYVVSAGSGVVLELCDLALLIDFPGRIWALQLPGLDGEAPPLTRMEDIAALYASAVLGQAGRGAAHLIGYSFGGLVVVEMARILKGSSCRLGLVGLLDSTCYEKFWPRSEWVRFAIRRARGRLAEVRRMRPRDAARHLAGRGLAVLRHLARRMRSAEAGAPAQSIYYIAGLEPNFQRVRDASIVAFEAYRPTPIDCRATLFNSALGDPHACDPVALWRPLIADLEIVPVPGSHTTMVRRPFAEALAREIGPRLRR